ncbi:hypothetical protein MPSEU_000616300 [Mayamaea pseudoterrestris]|nr:hypothetical protein MPSEU_000616300 [Mayamaea pseudoterrestris]
MRLFRVQGGAMAGATRFNLRGSKSHARGPSDEDSLGSSISPTEQFDIIVPLKMQPATAPWKFLGDQRDDDTDVSSITTDEYRYRRRNSAHSSYQTSSSTFCCCSNMPTETGTATDNTLIASRSPPLSDDAAIRDIYEADNVQPIQNGANAYEFINYCNPMGCEPPTLMACPYQPSAKQTTGEGRSLNRSNSLFDAISEDDQDTDQSVGHDTGPVHSILV